MEITNLGSRDTICGIYKILCTANNEFYFGSLKDLFYRLRVHTSLLRKKKTNILIQTKIKNNTLNTPRLALRGKKKA